MYEKVGQPIKMSSNKRGINMSFYVDPEEIKLLEEIRWREHMSLSEVVRKALKDYIKIHAAGNEVFKLDDFQDPNFRAMPATMSPKEKWSEYIKNNTDKKERIELDRIAKHISARIEAENWLDSRK